MSKVLDTRDVDGVEHRVVVEYDPDCDSPRDADCSAGVIVVQSRYCRQWPVEDGDSLTASRVADAVEEFPFRHVSLWLRVFHGATVVLPLYASSEGFSAGDESDEPDIGDYVGVTFDQPSTRAMTGVMPDHMASALSTDVEEFGRWASGETYGWVVERRAEPPHEDCHASHCEDDWEHVDSCWGYIGWDYAETEALQALSDA